MPGLRRNQFVAQLRQLGNSFPDYKNILDPLIDMIEQGRQARVKEKLDQLKKENW